MRIANINAARGDSCPSEWRKATSPTKPPHDNAECYPTHFTTCTVATAQLQVTSAPVNLMYLASKLQALFCEYVPFDLWIGG